MCKQFNTQEWVQRRMASNIFLYASTFFSKANETCTYNVIGKVTSPEGQSHTRLLIEKTEKVVSGE